MGGKILNPVDASIVPKYEAIYIIFRTFLSKHNIFK